MNPANGHHSDPSAGGGTAPLPFAAAVLAGGLSRRMGRDKARLPVGDGRTLLERQIERLRALRPQELFLSARDAGAYAEFGVPVLADRFPGQGPLAGIQRVLEAMTAPLLVVLGVDLPAVEPELLGSLLAAAGPDRGVVPCRDGQPEPLVAVYPKAAEPVARRRLEAGENSARAFVEACVREGHLRLWETPPTWEGCFVNWNRPEDLGRLPAGAGPR